MKSEENLLLAPYNLNPSTNYLGNKYKSVLAIGKRANDVRAFRKASLLEDLEDLNITDGLESKGGDSDILIMISRKYEMLQKPILVALDEFKGKKIYLDK